MLRFAWLLGLLSYGCATIGYTDPKIADAPVRSWRAEVPAEGVLGTAEVSGTKVSVTTQQSCEVRQMQLVKRTSTSEAENHSAALDWLIGGAGVASMGTGAIFLADAGNTYSSDKTSRTYNPVGSGTQTAYGVGFLAAGAALVAISVIDVVRAQDMKVETTEQRIPGDATDRIACSGRPLPGASVSANVDGRSFELGATDPRGKLTVDLDAVIDRDIVLSDNDLRIFANGTEIASVPIDALRAKHHNRAWVAVDAERCRAAETLDACDSAERYVKAYSQGEHADEVRQLLAEAKPKLTHIADDQHWASVDVKACTQNNAEFGYVILEACKPVSGYLEAFPDGVHAKAARAAVEQGQARAEVVERERKRQIAADERKEAEQERQRCIGMCKVVCSQLRYSSDPQGCFSGCVATQGCNQ